MVSNLLCIACVRFEAVDLDKESQVEMRSGKLQIAYLLENVYFKLTDVGGPQVHVEAVVMGMRRAGHRVTIVALDDRRVICTDGGAMNQFAQPGWSGSLPFLIAEWGILRLRWKFRLPNLALIDTCRFYEVCSRELRGYDLLHERYTLFSLGGALVSRRLGIPLVLEVNADPIHELGHHLGQPLRGIHRMFAVQGARYTYEVSAAIICPSQALRQRLMRHWQISPEKIEVIPNGVDVRMFRPDLDRSTFRVKVGLSDEPAVMFVGGFFPWHGLGFLVEAFRQAHRCVPAAKLILVGDGMTRMTIEECVRDSELTDSVIFAGALGHSEIPEALAAADVVVAPYAILPEEGWFSPLKLYEYMAAGKAIVASRSGQVAQVIEDENNGRLVEPGDVRAMAEAIVDLIQNPSERQRLGANAREQAVQQHSWEQRLARLEAVYRSVL